MYLSKILGVVITLSLFACTAKEHDRSAANSPLSPSDLPTPPQAPKQPRQFAEHGYTRTDDYYWLKDKSNPEVIRYLEAENAYSDTAMAHTKALQEQLFQEMKGRIKEADATVPVFQKGYYYYQRTEKAQQYPVFCRKKGSLNAAEEVLLDGNVLAEGKPTLLIGGYTVSPDNRLLAYRMNHTGSYVEFTLRIRDIQAGKDLPYTLKDVGQVVWANDNRTLFYTKANTALRPYQVYRWQLGTNGPGILLYEERDDLFEVSLSKSKNGHYIFMGAGSYTASEYRYVDANKPLGAFTLITARKPAVRYYPAAHTSNIYFLVKDTQAPNFKVMRAPAPGFEKSASWTTCVAHDPAVKIESIEVFEQFLVLYVRSNGLQGIQIHDLQGKKLHTVQFPEPVFALYPAENPVFSSTTLRYTYMSMNRPMSTYEYDMGQDKRVLLKQDDIPGGFNPADYVVKRIWATAPDGVKVPMAVLYKKGLRQNGANPALLYSYGSYGYSTDPAFNSNVLSLVDRGFVFAIAQIRGGSEMGEWWYESGKLLKKKNTFTDFIACAEQLIEDKYTKSSLLAINGLSAGGLLMGAVANMRPDLFKVVVAEVPFVDVINTMLDPGLPLTTQEWEQWGNPNNKTYYDYMRSYSPYDNIARKAYPNMLLTGGLNDSQVLFHEPAKFAAKLRALKTDNNLLLLKTNMDSGHGGATGRFDYLKEEAFRMAFIMDRLGIEAQKLKN